MDQKEMAALKAHLKAATGKETIEGAIITIAQRLDAVEKELAETRLKKSAASDKNYPR